MVMQNDARCTHLGTTEAVGSLRQMEETFGNTMEATAEFTGPHGMLV